MATTKIQWTDKVWNPITGCSKVSPGCDNCYAKKMASRLKGRFGYPADEPFKVTFHPDRLEEPGHWGAKYKVFVCSMSDLFHESVEPGWFKKIWAIMRVNEHLTFQILTKRPGLALVTIGVDLIFPKNIWVGVTVENQRQADFRIPLLNKIPAQTRFLSVEPMLEEIDLSGHLDKIDWVICGAETGQKARKFDPYWAIKIQVQCRDAGIPFFFKSFGPKAMPEPHIRLLLEDEKNFPK
jgi:protein gp37